MIQNWPHEDSVSRELHLGVRAAHTSMMGLRRGTEVSGQETSFSPILGSGGFPAADGAPQVLESIHSSLLSPSILQCLSHSGFLLLLNTAKKHHFDQRAPIFFEG